MTDDDKTLDGLEEEERFLVESVNSLQQEDPPEDPPEEEPESDETDSEIEKAEKRVKDAQRAMHEAKQEAARLRKDLDERDKQREDEITALRREIEALRNPPQPSEVEEEFPELVPEFKKRDEAISEQKRETAEVKKTAEEARREIADLRFKAKCDTIRGAHPDADDIVLTDKFKEWVRDHRYGRHIAETLGRIRTEDPQAIIAIFDEYKGPRKKRTDDPELVAIPKSKNRARTPNLNDKPPKFTRAQIAEMDDDTFMKNEDAILQAAASGLVV
jgi:hypothetical protein